MSNYNFQTRAIHVGSEPDPVTGAVIPPISLSTTFAQTAPSKPIGAFEYSRSQNPNRENFEKVIASLEKGKYGLAFSSGSAASGTILQSLASGGHVISIADVYGGTHRYFTKVASAHGITTDFAQDLVEELPKLIKAETKIVWIETPTNPTLKITDISKVKQIIKESSNPNIFLVVDNTFLSPYIQNPLEHGADIVVHSATKFINGHSDVVLGVAATNNDFIYEKLSFLQNALGAIPSAFDSWLAHRGVKTLALRVKQSASSAQKIAEFLSKSENVVSVNYPGLPTHKGYEIVQKQHRDSLGGGVISFRVKGGASGASKFTQSTHLFTLAESLGGIESLLEVPAVMTHGGIPEEERIKSGIYDDLIRLSVGIEDTEDLIKDIEQALTAAVSN
ncbi:Cystathionine gamma-synthase [Wickerhamomyces ciferrii]|uniref:cystathionine gamma-lyase n=1 Tax=Wickerhamomyces ciferrii (strain ATCC 14091 / BCRC 22168 / CBS 111 / JCM 3599 / NBRC 0793 / NRRL Y-1031 F-60-10) TaxID=1206466 RepID=K0KE62_WICCF|nr:Cystathionine gamma-synthase [Wickerhamomyces ciferrii]CCH40532.1 Cystathionine gamma-synthase [Wickerhamomyces ciferrii]